MKGGEFNDEVLNWRKVFGENCNEPFCFWR